MPPKGKRPITSQPFQNLPSEGEAPPVEEHMDIPEGSTEPSHQEFGPSVFPASSPMTLEALGLMVRNLTNITTKIDTSVNLLKIQMEGVQGDVGKLDQRTDRLDYKMIELSMRVERGHSPPIEHRPSEEGKGKKFMGDAMHSRFPFNDPFLPKPSFGKPSFVPSDYPRNEHPSSSSKKMPHPKGSNEEEREHKSAIPVSKSLFEASSDEGEEVERDSGREVKLSSWDRKKADVLAYMDQYQLMEPAFKQVMPFKQFCEMIDPDLGRGIDRAYDTKDKIQLAKLGGDGDVVQVENWIASLEEYFQLHPREVEKKIAFASLHLEGSAKVWWRKIMKEVKNGEREKVGSWKAFKTLVRKTFIPPSEEKALAYEWLSATQSGTVKAYNQTFWKSTLLVAGLTENMKLVKYLHGLSPYIHQQVMALNPSTVEEAMRLAENADSRSRKGASSPYEKFTPKGVGFPYNSSNKWASQKPDKVGETVTPSSQLRRYPDIRDQNFKKSGDTNRFGKASVHEVATTAGKHTLIKRSLQELAELRKKGLCLRCTLPWSPEHRRVCKFKDALFAHIDVDESGEDDGEEGGAYDSKDEMGNDPQEEGPALQYFQLEDEGEDGEDLCAGISCEVFTAATAVKRLKGKPQTLKLEGTINGKKVVVLVDSGSSHNFLNTQALDRLELTCTPTSKPYQITVANGAREECTQKCVGLVMAFDKYKLKTDFLSLPMGQVDVVLGVQWLQHLGEFRMNLRKGYIKFKLEGKWVTLCRPHSSCSSMDSSSISCQHMRVVSPSKMKKIFRQGVEGAYLALVTNVEECTAVNNGMDLKGVEMHEGVEWQTLIQEYHDIFPENLPSSLPPRRERDHAIVLTPHSKPINKAPYRMSKFERDEVDKQVKELLDSGLIRVSQSPFASPVLLVKKKDGTYRMCIDYRDLNEVTIKDRFPIPHIDDLLDELGGAKYFTKIDLRSGYHQIRIKEGDEYLTAFRTQNGLYEFLVMPFGLTNGPATFQALMNSIFGQALHKFVLVFFDDILIYSRSYEEHVEHLKWVLDIMRKNQLVAKKSKCLFVTQRVEYLGHIITPAGIQVDPSKVQVVRDWPIPTTLTQLRSFLGFAQFYRRFISHYSHIAAPLTDLTKNEGKQGFLWNERAQGSFETLKLALTSAPVLRCPDFSKPFTVEVDASGKGLGMVLMQEGQVIAYESRKLSPKEQTLSVYDQELAGLMHALKKWKQYLYGVKFVVHTDHQSLKYFKKQAIISPKQRRMLDYCQSFDFDIFYKKGSSNVVADALSRLTCCQIQGVATLKQEWIAQIQQEYLEDGATSQIYSSLQDPYCLKFPEFRLKSGLLWLGQQVYLAPNSAFKQIIMEECHTSPLAGHMGVKKTYMKVRNSFFWHGIKSDVLEFVKGCLSCQRTKVERLLEPGLLQPLPIPTQKWESISMDFITGLPSSPQGFDSIMVVVDRLTKYSHFLPIKKQISAPQVAQEFFRHVFKLHGMPKDIVSDRDSKFISIFWRELMESMGTHLSFSTAYHPQSDGQTERVNQWLEAYLRHYVQGQQRLWVEWLSVAEYCYNTTHHMSIGMSPFEALYGYAAVFPEVLRDREILTQSVKDRIFQMEQLMLKVKANLKQAQSRYKKFADEKRTEREFQVGDRVFLKIQPYRFKSLVTHLSVKLSPRYCGPYEITQRVGTLAYRLLLPPRARIHDVFHVSVLKMAVGKDVVISAELPPISDEGELELIPERVLGFRERHRRQSSSTEYLVKWRGLPVEEAHWVPARDLQAYPQLFLPCDKVFQ